MATRRISPPYTALLTSSAFTTTNAITTEGFYPSTDFTRATFFILATEDGTAKLQTLLSSGTWVDIVSSEIPIDADVMSTINVRMSVLGLRCIVTPSAAPGTVTVDASYSENKG